MSDTPEDQPPSALARHNADRLDALETAERIGGAVLSKTATWAVSIAVLILSVATSFGLLIYFVGDKLLAFQAASSEIRHLQSEHAHCQMEVTELKARVSILESRKTASNP